MKAAAPIETRGNLPVIAFASAAAFDAWLTAHGADSQGLWLKLAKKQAGVPCIGKPMAIEVALCHGWIDGQLDPYDTQYWLIRFTPRSAKSRWSQINRSTALRLIAEARMTPAGRAQVEAAQADGRWDAAYAPQSQATVPPDLQAALEAHPEAGRFFAQLTGANRYAVLYRINDARTALTRARRIEKFVAMLERHELVHPGNGKTGTTSRG